MTMIRAKLAGATLGALAVATVVFAGPLAAQMPGGSPPSGPDLRGPGATDSTGRTGENPAPRGPGMMGPGAGQQMGRGMMGPGMDRDMHPGMAGRRGSEGDEVDITGPHGDAAACQARLARMAQARLESIERLVRPTDAQRAAFDELKAAAMKALEIARAGCPSERPLTPPARMAAAEQAMEARLQALKTVRPALEAFYKTLSDEQKIRWIAGGRDQSVGDEGGRGGSGRWGENRRDGAGPRRDWRGRDWSDRFGEHAWRHHGWRDDRDGWRERREERGGPDWYDRFAGRPYGERWGRGWRDDDGRGRGDERWMPDRWRERWYDWHDRLGYGREGDLRERWGRRWRDDEWRGRDDGRSMPDRWRERWHDWSVPDRDRGGARERWGERTPDRGWSDNRADQDGRGGRDQHGDEERSRSKPPPDEERL